MSEGSGFVKSVSTAEALNVIAEKNATVRALGQECPVSSDQSSYIELGEVSVFQQMLKDLEHRLRREWEDRDRDRDREIGDLHSKMRKQFLFLGKNTMELALRCFADKVIETLYLHSGSTILTPYHKARWIWSGAPDLLIGEQFDLFGKRIRLTRDLLRLIRVLRQISMAVSRDTAHSSNALKVAYALTCRDDLEALKPLFLHLFAYTPEKFVDMYEAGLLDEESLSPFHVM